MSYVEPDVETPTTPSIDPAELESARATAERAQRESAILRSLPAGVDLSSPLAAMFVDSYKGEVTPDAVREAAAQVGLGAPPAPAVDPEVEANAELTELSNVRDGIATGGVLAPPTAEEIEAAVHPVDRAFASMKASMDAGAGREQAAQAWVGEVVAAASAGDERVIFNGWSQDQLEGRAGIHSR